MTTIIDGHRFIPAKNGTLVDKHDCNNDICSIEYGEITYLPSLGGNIAYLAIFSILLAIHLIIGIRRRTWTFLIGIACGLVLEIVGYLGRILLHENDFVFIYFVL